MAEEIKFDPFAPSVKPTEAVDSTPVAQDDDESLIDTISSGYNSYWEGRAKANLWANNIMSSPEFVERYRNYAKSRPEIWNTGDEEWDDMTADELMADFYRHGTMRNNNSVAMSRDLIDLGLMDKTFKKEWEYMDRVFHAAPAWGDHRSGWSAFGDIGTAVVTEPLNLFGGLGVWKKAVGVVNQMFLKQGVGGVAKEEYIKQVKKKAVKLGAINVAKYNAYASAGLDTLKQTNMKVANPDYEFSPTRTLFSAGVGGLVGYPMGHISSSIHMSRVNPDVYFNKDVDWIKISDLGTYNGKPILSLEGQSGYVVNDDGVQKIIPIEKGTLISDKDGQMGEVISSKYPDKAATEKDIVIKYKDGSKKTVKESEVLVQDPESLPKNLSGASPKYFYRDTEITLEFENDIVKALYIVGGKGKSKEHDEYIKFLELNNVENISAQAQKMRNFIKTEAKKGITDVAIADYHAISKKALPKNVIEVAGVGKSGENSPILSREAKSIAAKADEYSFERKVFRNRNQMTDEDSIRFDSVMKFIKENYKTLQGKNKYIKEFRVTVRKLEDILDDFAERANIKISKSTRAEIIEDALDWAKTGKDGGVNLIAARLQNSADMDNLDFKIAQTNNAKTPEARAKALEQQDKALNDVIESMYIVDRLQTVLSDNLTAAKVKIKLTDFQKLKKEVIKRNLDDILKNKEKLKPEDRSKLTQQLRHLLNNENKMFKYMREYEQKVGSNVTFGAWYNEFTTANLLGDPITHMVNITSGLIKINWDTAHNLITAARLYSGGKLVEYNSFRSAGAKRAAQREIQLAKDVAAIATDKFTYQFSMIAAAFHKGGIAWRKQSTVGDIYNTKYNDGRIERVHELYTDKLKASNNMFARGAGYFISPFSSMAYTTFRLLGVGDTMLKQLHFNASRVAIVNHRMRKMYPELWAQNSKKQISATNLRIKTKSEIESLEAAIRLEESTTGKGSYLNPDQRAFRLTDLFKKGSGGKHRLNAFMTKKDRIQFYKDRIKLLKEEDSKTNKTDFEKTWLEMFDEYQDEFGNFQETSSFSAQKLNELDFVAKSPVFDPTITARESTFTNSLTSPYVPHAKDPVFNNHGGAGEWLLNTGYEYPLLKTLFGVNFIRTPVQLNRFNWHYTPIVNKLHFQFNAMLKSDDPIVRASAETTEGLAYSLYGLATYLYLNGRLVADHPDPDKRNSIITEDGEYIKIDRIYPFNHPFTVVPTIGDKLSEFAHIWDDPLHASASAKVGDFTKHAIGMSAAVMDTALNSQLVTNQAFDLLEGIIGTGGMASNKYEQQKAVNASTRFAGSAVSKNIPLGTTFKWANRELAEADHEMRLFTDKVAKASPHAFIAEIIGDPRGFQPKRGRTYKIKPKTQGYVPFYGTTAWDNIFKYSIDDVRHVFKTEQGAERYAELMSDKQRPSTEYTMLGRNIFNLDDFVVTKYKDPNTGKIVKARDGQTFYDLRLQLAGELVAEGKNIEGWLSWLLDNPNNAFNTKMPTKYIGGIREDAKVVKAIHTAFETAALHYLVENAYAADFKGKDYLPIKERMLEVGGIFQKEYIDYAERADAAIKALTDPYQ